MEQGYIYIEETIFPSLFAISQDEQTKGLMYEPFPPPIMSFVYDKPRVNMFWMKNTPSPLDIVFCCGGEVIDIYKGEPYSTSTIGGNFLSDFIIELPYGTAKSNNFRPLNKVGIIKPTNNELKKIIAKKYAGCQKF